MDNNTSITVSMSELDNQQAQTIRVHADAIFISQESSLDSSSLGDTAGPGKGDERVMEVREVAFQRTTFLTHLIYLKLWVIHSASEYLFSV